MSNIKNEFKQTPNGNWVLDCDGFFISYNDFSAFNPMMIGMFSSDDGSDETALCADGDYYILNGDFRIEYAGLSKQGLAACKEFYEQNKDNRKSSWSN